MHFKGTNGLASFYEIYQQPINKKMINPSFFMKKMPNLPWEFPM
jgi:hypothetical protein